MAAKILLAVIAALCAFATLNANASPLIKHIALEQDEVMQALSANPELRFPGINVTAILEAIENILAAIEDKIDEVSDEAESAIDAVLVKIEDAAEAAAKKWNATVQEWVDKANQAGVDISACLKEQQSLADVVAELKLEAKECVDDRMNDLDQAILDVKALGPKAKLVLEEAKHEIKECMTEGIWAAPCIVALVPKYEVQQGIIMTQAVLLSARVGVKAAAIIPMTSLCTAKVTAGCGAEASAIVDSTVSCIRAALDQ